ncbi:hypothetical protein DSUL_100169 [Desulfovibrionales bacterium]
MRYVWFRSQLLYLDNHLSLAAVSLFAGTVFFFRSELKLPVRWHY